MNGRNWSIVLSIFLAIIAIAAIAARYSEPVNDGDIWFHLAYGRYFIENFTLIPDHTIFSWTPAENTSIYCAWIPEVFFYLLYKVGGTYSLYALRYLVIVVFITLLLTFQMLNRKAFFPTVVFICFTGLLMSYAGLRIKPELISFLLMSFMAWVWFRIKAQPNKAMNAFYLFPLISLIWVNSHGGFIFGMIFLALVVLGEGLNKGIGSSKSLGDQDLKKLLIFVLLSFLTIFMTPYGWRYPLHLVNILVLHPEEFQKHMKTVAEYQTIFFPQALSLHFPEYFAAAAFILGILIIGKWKRKSIDWAVLLVNASFMLIFIKFLRTTYFWGIIFSFSALYLLNDNTQVVRKETKHRLLVAGANAIVIILLLFSASGTLYETTCMPSRGFHPAYITPVVEAEYIKRNFSNLRIGNDYTCGSYLIWALWPTQKVFIDSRYFPYSKWYQEYAEFEDNTSKRNNDIFLEKFRCDLWCISHDSPLLSYFMGSSHWRLVYYGPSSVLFLSKGIESRQQKHSVSREVYDMGIYQAYDIAQFAASAGDLEVAEILVSQMNPMSFCPTQMDLALNAGMNVGNHFLALGRYADAIRVYMDALGKEEKRILPARRFGNWMPADTAALHEKLGYSFVKLDQIENAIIEYKAAIQTDPDAPYAKKHLPFLLARMKKIDEAIMRLEERLESHPNDPDVIHSLALCHSMKGQYAVSLDFLEKELEIRPGKPDIYYNMACIYSRQGKIDEALHNLDKAVQQGFKEWDLMKKDYDLNNLRDNVRFKKLMQDH